MKIHKVADIQNIFNKTFGTKYNVCLVTGADEPFYKAAKCAKEKNILFSREDFFSSALHEIAHWCVAGSERRKLDDFGYWYIPDGRELMAQKQFENVEVFPQALEKAFTIACQKEFIASSDNLDIENYDPTSFRKRIDNKHDELVSTRFPARAALFIESLTDFYRS